MLSFSLKLGDSNTNSTIDLLLFQIQINIDFEVKMERSMPTTTSRRIVSWRLNGAVKLLRSLMQLQTRERYT